MLFKLLKYEIKASARTLWPLYVAILALSVVTGFGLGGFSNQSFFAAFEDGAATFFGLLGILLAALYVALGVLTLLSIIQRFNNNLLGDEGFLMFTLPVKSHVLLLSKLLAAAFWAMMAGIIGFLSMVLMMLAVMAAAPDVDFFNEMLYLLNHIGEIISLEEVWFMIQFVILTLSALCATILTAYLAMMIAQLQRFNNHRIIVAVIAFFLISWLVSVISEPFLTPTAISVVNMLLATSEGMSKLMWVGTAAGMVECVVFFLIVNYMLNKHLNL